jgi:hypothetical protein
MYIRTYIYSYIYRNYQWLKYTLYVYIFLYIFLRRLLNLQLETSNIRSCIAPVPLCTVVMKLKLPALQSTLAHSTDLPLHVNQ